MVGIQMISSRPSRSLHRRFRGTSGIGRRAADQCVFAVRLVPDRDDFDAGLCRLLQGSQLRDTLASEPVSDPKREFFDTHGLEERS